MDTATLVNEQIDDGKQLVEGLTKSGFDVAVAFWVLTSEEGLWFLYIASPVVDKDSLATAYRKVYSEISKCRLQWVSHSDVKLIGVHDTATADAIAFQGQNLPTRYGGRRLGNMIIEEAYIYPKLS